MDHFVFCTERLRQGIMGCIESFADEAFDIPDTDLAAINMLLALTKSLIGSFDSPPNPFGVSLHLFFLHIVILILISCYCYADGALRGLPLILNFSSISIGILFISNNSPFVFSAPPFSDQLYHINLMLLISSCCFTRITRPPVSWDGRSFSTLFRVPECQRLARHR